MQKPKENSKICNIGTKIKQIYNENSKVKQQVQILNKEKEKLKKDEKIYI